MESATKIIVGITQGDINGISYEIILKSLTDSRIFESFTPVIYGSPKVAAYHRKTLNLPNQNVNSVKTAGELIHNRLNIINCTDDNIRVELGKSTKSAGEASFNALNRAVADLKSGLIDVLVTAPINKNNIQSNEFNFPGHTEYLAEEFKTKDVVMLMVSDNIRIGVATGHIPLKNVTTEITSGLIYNKLKTINKSLIEDFAIRKPIIAVLGLNPHASDGGIIGTEEETQIEPAIKKARNEGIMAMGPFPADGFFGSGNFKKFDAILAMYHDQGLIPFKSISFDNGVNYSAGLPIVRTSPAHGTAYEIAGKNVASEQSFLNSIYLAIDIYKNRKLLEGIEPLQKQTIIDLDSQQEGYIIPQE